MDYKVSKFNITVPIENSNEIILFNSKECSFVVLDEEHQGFINDINQLNLYDEEVLANLTELGFVVDGELDEVENMKRDTREARLSSDALSITIATTLDCNMNCYYCFEDKNQQYMSKDVADQIIQHITSQLSEGDYKSLMIIWTGGEPLLNRDIIEYISLPLMRYCSEKELEYRASTITNGLLLTEEAAKFLSDMKVREVQVTIDGLETTHNKRRLSLEDCNSFQTILEHINTAHQYLAVVIRVNIDHHNKEEIRQLIDFLYHEMDFKNNEKISLSLAQVNECAHSMSLQDFLDFYRDIYDDYVLDTKIEKYYPAHLKFACGALCRDSYVIGPEADVYRCWEQVGMKRFSIGSVDKIDHDCKESTEYLMDMWPTECDECAYLPMCHGGCPKARQENGNKPICYPQVNALDKYLKKYYEYWKMENEEPAIE